MTKLSSEQYSYTISRIALYWRIQLSVPMAEFFSIILKVFVYLARW